MTTFNGEEVTGATFHGEDVTEMTYNGDVVWTAETTSVIEGFESGDLSNWSGHGSSATVQTADVYEGTYALELSPGFSFGSQPGDGLPHYPTPGDKWSFRFRTDDSSGRMYLQFFEDGGDSWYGYLLDADGDLELRKDGGSTTLNDTVYDVFDDGQWYRIVTDWATNGDYTIELYDESDSLLETMTGNDTDNTASGLYFLDIDAAGDWHFDDFLLYE